MATLEVVIWFQIDEEDFFYSIPHGDLIQAVQLCIDLNGSVAFQNSTGISVEKLLDHLPFYLNSTFISFKGNTFLRKSGICIGSSVAPILSDIYLAGCAVPLQKG